MSTHCGIGYDLHRLEAGRKLIVGGVELPFDKGPVGHSDGDVLAHALCDALLGAAGLGSFGVRCRRVAGATQKCMKGMRRFALAGQR